MRRLAASVIALVVAGCGGSAREPSVPLPRTAPGVGPGPLYRPPSVGHRARRALPTRGLHCSRADRSRHGVHLELFAARHVVLIPPGIGIAPPRKQLGAYVGRGRCSYPLRTREPTGLIEAEPTHTLGDFFAIWGQPLTSNRMAGFRGEVRAYVNGRVWATAPARIPLTRHAQIVLEVGGYVRPHTTYGFPPGM